MSARLTLCAISEIAPRFPHLAVALSGCDRIGVYDIALTRRFRRIDRRDGVLIHGEAGWGEVSPFWDYGVAESAAWFAAGVEAATCGFPVPVRERVPVNATIPVCDPEAAARIVAAHAGVAAVKVKVADPGVTLEADCARVAAVRDALGPAGAIRVDANAAWTVDQAVAAIAALDRAVGGLEYVEQPVAEVADMAEVRRQVNVPVAADESVRRARDPLAVVRAGACDLIVTKVQPLGGVRAALALAEDAGVPVVVSSAIDTSVGLAMGAHLAACLPDLPHACGLGTSSLLTGDVTTSPLTPRNGRIDVRPVDVDAALPACASDLVERWFTRLEDVCAFREAAR